MKQRKIMKKRREDILPEFITDQIENWIERNICINDQGKKKIKDSRKNEEKKSTDVSEFITDKKKKTRKEWRKGRCSSVDHWLEK